MNLIADASVMAKWLFRETGNEPAERLIEAWADGRLTLHAPEIVTAEVASWIWKRVIRDGMPHQDAQHLYSWFMNYCPILVPVAGLTEAALELAVRHRQRVYDCLYVALAMQTDTAFVTADERLCRAFQGMGTLVRSLDGLRGPGGLATLSI